MRMNLGLLLGSVATISLVGPNISAVSAQDDSSFSFEEIVVTARKRSENVYEVPAAISAFSADRLKAQNIDNVDDLGKYVPNLNISRYGVGNTAHASIFIRGIGLQDHIITTDPGVGVYLDGVYLGRQMGANMGLNNIERIEVLRGPQGTLYGRNTLGGAVNIITKKPGEEDGATVSAKVGTRGTFAGDVYASTKLNDSFGIALSGSFKRREGVGEAVNIPNPEAEIGEIQEISGRISANWDVSDNFSLLFAFDGVDNNSGQSPYTIEFTTPVDPNDIFNGDFPLLGPDDLPADPDDSGSGEAGLESTSHSGYGLAATATWTMSEAITAKLITSYRQSEYTGGLDDDGSILDLSQFPETGRADQTSIELQINGSYDKMDFVAGLYYFEEDGRTESGPWSFSPFNTPGGLLEDGVTPSFGTEGFFDLNQRSKSKAAYVNVKYQVTEDLNIGGGLRYSKDDKVADALFPTFNFLPPITGRKEVDVSYDDVTWDINVAYAFSETMNFYAQVQKGYKPGGLPPRPFGGSAQFVASQATTATNYEIGIKGQVGDNISMMLAVFTTDYNNLNLPISDTSGVGFDTAIADDNKSRARGVELETTVLLSDNFRVNATLGYLDAEITEVLGGIAGLSTNIVEGDVPALTPKWTFSIAPEFRMQAGDGMITVSADYSYRSSMFGQSVNNPFELMSSRDLLGFSAEYESADATWTMGLYGKNVLNEVYDQGRLIQNGYVGIVRSNDRSEFGVRFTKNFGL